MEYPRRSWKWRLVGDKALRVSRARLEQPRTAKRLAAIRSARTIASTAGIIAATLAHKAGGKVDEVAAGIASASPRTHCTCRAVVPVAATPSLRRRSRACNASFDLG